MTDRQPVFSRRALLRRAGAAALAVPATGASLAAAESATATAIRAAADTDLIYLANERADGALGRCQAEVWFVPLDGEFVVVTDAKSWRVRQARREDSRVRIWVGDVGRWQNAKGAWRDLPSISANGRLDADPAFHEKALAAFGRKYPASWLLWGPRFRNGLADGSRLLLRYQPLA
ncbi:MAG: hypothetical protein AAGI15_09660 [Pseudomonadota bacterium]